MILSEAKKILNKNGYQLVESKSDEQLSLLKKLLDENDIDYDDLQDAGSIYVTRNPTNDVEITYNTNPRYSDGIGFYVAFEDGDEWKFDTAEEVLECIIKY